MTLTADHCVFYSGILGGDILDKQALADRQCKAGVKYADVKETESGYGLRFPCVDSQRGTIKCPLHQYPTKEQLAESERETNAAIERFIKVVTGELKECLECNAPVDHYVQIGPCVYSNSCSHRQYQGKLPPVR